jgi:hypothetical protein
MRDIGVAAHAIKRRRLAKKRVSVAEKEDDRGQATHDLQAQSTTPG